MSGALIFHIIGGPNGSGKTTFAKEYLPNEAQCLKFLNSDEIAQGLSPFNSAAAQIQAGKILLKNLNRNLEQGKSFALESTLSGKSYLKHIRQAKILGFEIKLDFLWLPSPEESHARVKSRVLEGGHSVSREDIYRRYPRILQLIFSDYLPIVDRWQFWDASNSPMILVANSTHISPNDLQLKYENYL
ncbi:MAG: AAA family ATPase [Verrucomicrobiales bacterium]|nr:AAA family ATPase [Verrucomicrobiales bacterium]